MVLHTSFVATPGHIVRRLMHLALLMACAVPLHQAAAGGVYVSGQSMPLDQAFGRALAENPRKTKDVFWIVVAGAEVNGLTKKGANADILGWLKSARERGGMVLVCRSDMTRGGIQEDDLLDGVTSMYGYGAQDWAGLLPARKEEVALPDNMKQSQLILKTCTGDLKPGS